MDKGYYVYKVVSTDNITELKKAVYNDIQKEWNRYEIKARFAVYDDRDTLKFVRYGKFAYYMGKYGLPDVVTLKGFYTNPKDILNKVDELLDSLLDNPESFVQNFWNGGDDGTPLTYKDLQYLTVDVKYYKVQGYNIMELPNLSGDCKVKVNLTEYKSKYVFYEDDFCEKFNKKHSYAENETLQYPQFRAKEICSGYVDLSRDD